jgi:translation initiation factor 2B subunit (eIF-2B alpha/beta/delta family)
MAPLVNLINTTLWQLEQHDSADAMQSRLVQAAHEFKRAMRVHETAIAEATMALIPDGASVLTCSRSSTVSAALLYAQRAGRRFHVTCAEGRPGCEGRTLAYELASVGIDVTLVTDGLICSRVTTADAVLIGADHLSIHHLVNKAGTLGLATAARAYHVPTYALCSSTKFLPADYTPPDQEQRPPEQVWPSIPAGIRVENYYFDQTPLEYISAIVTEQGVLTAEGVQAWLASTRLHPALHDSVSARTVGNAHPHGVKNGIHR